jgi:proton-coupled amino acid transporter
MSDKPDWVDTPGSDHSRREADIVERHLPEGYSADPEAVVYDATAEDVAAPAPLRSGSPELESSLRLQGGDMHRDIFRIKAKAAAGSSLRRSATFSAMTSPRLAPLTEPGVSDQLQPGGMRRQYVQRHKINRSLSTVATPVTRNFVSFLELYGSFAGEDLEDTDSASDSESAIEEGDGGRREGAGERRPLLGKRKSTRRIKRDGDAGMVKSFFTLLKAFVGTGIMFLPKAFRNGGILFSSITLILVSIITTLCFRLLLQCRTKYGGGGYGELGESIFGRKFRSLILASITLSQLGFVCAGLIFTAENLLAFVHAVVPAGQPQPFGTASLIAIQFVVLIPLSLIRNIGKLGPAALLADVFILIGLVYIWNYDIQSLSTYGMAPTVKLFNPSAFTLTIGSAIFTFEGIGLILPIQSSMREPEKFSYLLYLVMFIITCIFTSVGALCYATFGEETKIQIISNYPQGSKLVNAVQFIYSMAVLVGEPVQLFPAVRIIEQALFGDKASGKKSAGIKWQKNALRTAAMAFCGVVAILGASDLDKFVSLIGAFACVPLVYIYPPVLHLRGMATTKKEKIYDWMLISVGVLAMAYTTIQTLKQWYVHALHPTSNSD